MTKEELLDALASDHFQLLVNYGSEWRLSYNFPREERGTMSNKHLDKLLEDWHEKLQKFLAE